GPVDWTGRDQTRTKSERRRGPGVGLRPARVRYSVPAVRVVQSRQRAALNGAAFRPEIGGGNRPPAGASGSARRPGPGGILARLVRVVPGKSGTCHSGVSGQSPRSRRFGRLALTGPS